MKAGQELVIGNPIAEANSVLSIAKKKCLAFTVRNRLAIIGGSLNCESIPMTTSLQILAWSALIVAVTAATFSLRWKAGAVVAGVFDHSITCAAMGMMFVLAYPDDRRAAGIVCIVGVAVVGFLHASSPDRPGVEHAILRALATVIGLLLGAAVLMVTR